jgi:hypothetical protein
MNNRIREIIIIRNKIERREKTTLIDNRLILRILRISIYTPTTPNTEIPFR